MLTLILSSFQLVTTLEEILTVIFTTGIICKISFIHLFHKYSLSAITLSTA